MNDLEFSEKIDLKNLCMSIMKGKNLENLLQKMRFRLFKQIDALNGANEQELIHLKWRLEALKALRQQIKEIAEEKII